ncbi:MAG: CopD family protein [Alphaproteobacteria bacterium]|nr:CopD family protein [Alphaproteobacteria bacterium]
MIFGLLLHILAATIWVGGMFFAHFMLRPAAAPLEPGVRLPLMRRALARFFPWVWVSIALLALSGAGMIKLGADSLSIQIMMGLGIVMMLAFGHLYFAPWRRFQRALDGGDLPAAAAQLTQVRAIVTFNLVLGLVVVAIGATGRYWQ